MRYFPKTQVNFAFHGFIKFFSLESNTHKHKNSFHKDIFVYMWLLRKSVEPKLFFLPIQLVSIYAMRCLPELVWWWTIYDSRCNFIQTATAIVMVKSNEMLLTAAMQRSTSASAINCSLCNDWTCNEDTSGCTADTVSPLLANAIVSA